jgi:hypothetical protein
MRRVDDGKDVHLYYDNLYEAVRHGRDAPSNWKGRHSDVSSHRTSYGDDFYGEGKGTSTWDEADRLALDGWQEGVEKLVDLREQLMTEIGRALPEPMVMMDVSGFDVDVGAYMSGVPENMLTTWEMDGNKRNIHIVYNQAVSWNIKPETMMLRGLLVAGLVDTLEHLGHRVRLDVVALIRAEQDNGNLTVTHHMKAENEALDVERVVFACAHSSMFRRITFANMEMMDHDTCGRFGVPHGGYGYPGYDRDVLPEGERGDIFIGSTESPTSLAHVTTEVIGYLRKSGILNEERGD